MRKALCVVALVGSLAGIAQAQANESLFPRPGALEPAVRFWTRVYTEIDTKSGFIHDSEHLDVVYETIRFSSNPTSRERRRATTRATQKYRDILLELAAGERGALSTDEARVLALWPKDTSDAEFGRAAQRLRFQLGQADRFREGLKRSGRWKPYIYEVLEANGMPRELAALPHVESSFDPTAYSKVGAAGLWQFTRSTGLRYMQIDHIIDERRDPFLSSAAAARLLQDNYSVIQSWPLAITAYNHGLAGMRRAAAVLKSTDIDVVVNGYTGRTFGFASRNFYAAFLAALDVDANAERYFGKLKIDEPEDQVVLAMPDYMDAEPVARALGVRRSELQRLNPALMETVWEGDKFIPKGFELRVPRSVGADPAAMLASVPNTERYAQQRPDLQHRVRRGQTLSEIAEIYHVSLATLVRANGLRSRNFIRAGQLLTLPVAANQTPASLAEAAGEPVSTSGEYVVRRGDSIDRIARRFGVDEAALLSANNVHNRNLIYAGQVLRLPTDGELVAANETEDAASGFAGELVADSGLEAIVAVALIDGDGAATEDAFAGDFAAAGPAADDSPADITANVGEVAIDDASSGAGFDSLAAVLEPAFQAGRELGFVVATADHAADEGVSSDFGPEFALAFAPDVASDPEVDAEPDLDSNVLASTQAALAADPSDYTVADDSSIEVQAEETLGHYADWLEIRTQRLRDVNGMPFGEPVVIGQRIRLDFSAVEPEQFEQRRIAYQEQRQEAFFLAYQIADITEHVVRRGESLYLLALRTYNVPVWLLRQYNPDLDLDRVRPGTVVKFPALVPVAGESPAAANPGAVATNSAAANPEIG